MTTLAIVLQVIIALGILNVWLLRYDRATPYRPAGASSMKEEFARYGLPAWSRAAIGVAKVTLALMLIAGIWFPALALAAAAGLALLMVGAVGAHLKIGDPLRKAVPAFSMMVLCLLVVVAHTANGAWSF